MNYNAPFSKKKKKANQSPPPSEPAQLEPEYGEDGDARAGQGQD